MKSSTRGVLAAAAVALVALTIGQVLVFHAGKAPAEKPTAPGTPQDDDATLSAETWGQAPEAQSQALPDRLPAPAGPLRLPQAEGEAAPQVSPVDAEARAAPAQESAPRGQRGGAVYDRAIADARRIERPISPVDNLRREVIKKTPHRREAINAPFSPAAVLGSTSPCTIATSGDSPVAAACQKGGQGEAKRMMKRLVVVARARGARFSCQGCHVDLDDFQLLDGARTEFAKLLDVAR